MKLRILFPTVFATYLLFSCQSNSDKAVTDFRFRLDLVDSIQVEFLGEMRLQDYDPNLDQYLLVSDVSQHYLEVGSQGDIIHNVPLSTDGVDAVSYPLGYSYVNGKVVLLNEGKGFLHFDKGKKEKEVSVPYSFSSFIYYPKLNYFDLGEKALFPFLWPSDLEMSFDNGDFYLKTYSMPLMLSMDLMTTDTLGMMYLPETSPIKDGKIHGVPVPVVSREGNEWLLSMWIEPRFYVYEQREGKLAYQRTVELKVPDWVGYKALEPSQAGLFFEEIQKLRTGSLVDLLYMEDYVLAIYQKGIPEEKFGVIDRRSPEGIAQLGRMNPFWVAVFDKEFNLLQTDLPLPKGVHAPSVVNKNGELVTTKNPSLSEVEDEGPILYRMKLVKE